VLLNLVTMKQHRTQDGTRRIDGAITLRRVAFLAAAQIRPAWPIRSACGRTLQI
jgi:hypothetical protein